MAEVIFSSRNSGNKVTDLRVYNESNHLRSEMARIETHMLQSCKWKRAKGHGEYQPWVRVLISTFFVCPLFLELASLFFSMLETCVILKISEQ
jgi:hypothetical protein